MTTAQEIEQLERQRFAAQVSKDYAFLEQVFADDLVYTHSNGQQEGKAVYIDSIRTGQSRYDKVDIQEILVRDYHNQTAVVNATVRIEAGHGSDGQPLAFRIKYAVVYIQQTGGNWQLVLWHAQKQAG